MLRACLTGEIVSWPWAFSEIREFFEGAVEQIERNEFRRAAHAALAFDGDGRVMRRIPNHGNELMRDRKVFWIRRWRL